MLNVEVEEVEGPMTCNIPPPPSDRLWYVFLSISRNFEYKFKIENYISLRI